MDRRQPLFDILDQQGRSMRWLARAAGLSYWTIASVKYGRRHASPEFRTAAARALGLPESALFRNENNHSAA